MDKKDSSGSTALIVVLTGEKIYISWVGDSTCWNFWKNSLELITEPHKPSNVTERYFVFFVNISRSQFLRLRIEYEGGVITGKNESDLRIHGEISVTRALGNSGPRPMILAKPEHKVFDKDQSDGNFVI